MLTLYPSVSIIRFICLPRITVPFFFSRMTTRFNKAKLVEAQEKKAKADLTGGLQSRKCQRESEPPKDNAVVTSSVAKSQDRCPTLPTSFLELIISPSDGSKAKAMSNA